MKQERVVVLLSAETGYSIQTVRKWVAGKKVLDSTGIALAACAKRIGAPMPKAVEGTK